MFLRANVPVGVGHWTELIEGVNMLCFIALRRDNSHHQMLDDSVRLAQKKG